MKLVGIILKAVVAMVTVVAGLKAKSILEIIVYFGMIYGLLTYYIWFFRKHGFSFRAGSMLTTLLSLCFSLAIPWLCIFIPYAFLNTVLPGQLGLYIGGIILIALCFGCLALDVIEVIRTFDPSFLEGVDLGESVKKIFLKGKGKN